MKIRGQHYRTIWANDSDHTVQVIDQTKLPFSFETVKLATLGEAATAIRTMIVRGAPLIGATAAYGMAIAMHEDASDASLKNAYDTLLATRPTAVNLVWALNLSRQKLSPLKASERVQAAYKLAAQICDDDVAACSAIGDSGLPLIQSIAKSKSQRVNILTHCNAGWLATVDWGTALAPIYKAFDLGVDLHVWVDETRPRNQGASLTAWELQMHGVPHTLIADNSGGHLMQHGQVDICFVGTDRTTSTGDVCNKVGTYLKALAAHDNNVPFYVAAPSSSIDWQLTNGIKQIPIEERSPREVSHITGQTGSGDIVEVQIVGNGTPALNVAFDVTPARYVTGLITERGICRAAKSDLARLFPDLASSTVS